jgi:hypothetical protein
MSSRTIEDRLLFLIGPPRSGSTLLTRMLGSHDAVHAPDEPHLLTPLAHLGYYAKVDAAPYDPIITQLAMQELVKALPQGEEDFLAAMRAMTDTLYERLLTPTGRSVLLDKTPAYSLILDFAAKLYPNAHYLVLTRHPMAIWSSLVESFFDGDAEAAHRHQPLLERYVPAIARFLRERPVKVHHVRYEELVRNPESEMEKVCQFAGLDFDAGIVDYGDRGGSRESAKGLGDPMTVAKHSRPTTGSLSKWAEQLTGQPGKVALCQQILATLADVALGYTMAFSTDPPGNLVTSNLTLDFAGTARRGDWLQTSVDIQKQGKRLAFGNCYISAGDQRIVRASAVFLVTGALS